MHVFSKNVEHASTCDFVGRRLGDLFGYALFTELNSKEFCNTWLRSEPKATGILSFPGEL